MIQRVQDCLILKTQIPNLSSRSAAAGGYTVIELKDLRDKSRTLTDQISKHFSKSPSGKVGSK